ncbi:pentapeptide repeat-containing protein [Streptomyces paradoxus]|uniref:pentapeptide repeat-containing protein n=1 Tax=Streptomyces paradoxus TaxID=66375 RepID=UPI0036F765C4
MQRIMEDSPRDQPSIIDVLYTYVRNHSQKRPDAANFIPQPASDIQAALTALASRDRDHNGTARVDLHGANLTDANLTGADLSGAGLTAADLVVTDLHLPDLTVAASLRGSESAAQLHTHVRCGPSQLGPVRPISCWHESIRLGPAWRRPV